MNEELKKNRDVASGSIIKNHMVWSMGAGIIPIPFIDLIAVTGIQLDMIRQISKLYGIDYKETEGKAIITSLTGSGLARMGAGAIKLIPGVGSILGGVTLAVLSGANTYALGEVFKKHFETGGTFLDFDPGRLKKYYDEKFEKGKKVAADIQKEQKEKEKKIKKVEKIDVIDKLKELAQLKESGIVTEEEFNKLKEDLLNGE